MAFLKCATWIKKPKSSNPGVPRKIFWHVEDGGSHIGIRAAKIVTLKPFRSSTNFDPDLRPGQINCFAICFCKLLYNLLENICNTNHIQSLVKSCLRWLLLGHMRSITSSVLASKFQVKYKNKQYRSRYVIHATVYKSSRYW